MLIPSPGPPPTYPSTAVERECLYVVGNKILARGSGRQLGDCSRVGVCPTCGDLWSRLALSGCETSWLPVVAICPRCPHGHSAWFPAGSIFPLVRVWRAGMGEEYEWENLLPPEVLAREARLHLAHYEYRLQRGDHSRIMGTQTAG